MPGALGDERVDRIDHRRRDPGLARELGDRADDRVDLWQTWDAVECPTLVLRGAESDLLPESTARRMQERGPRVKLAEFAGIGHAPWLMSIDQIEMVADFILATERRMS